MTFSSRRSIIRADEKTIEIDTMWIDCTVGMIHDTFWMIRLSGVSLSHWQKACRDVAITGSKDSRLLIRRLEPSPSEGADYFVRGPFG